MWGERLNVCLCRFVRALARRQRDERRPSLCRAMPAPNCEAAPYQRYRFDKETITIVSAVNGLLAFELKVCVLLPSPVRRVRAAPHFASAKVLC